MKKKRRQRLILLGVATLVLVAAGAGAWILRQELKARRLDNLRRTGMAAYERGEHSEALEDLSDAVGGGVRDPDVLIAFADCRRKLPRDAGEHLTFAARVLDRVPRDAPERTRALEMLVEIYSQLGATSEWGVTIDELLKRDEANRLALESSVMLGIGEGDRGRVEKAVAGLEEHYGDDFQARLLGVVAARELGDTPDQLRRRADGLDEEFADRIGLWIFKSAIEMERGDFEEAAAMVRKALELPIETAEELESLVDVVDTLARSEAGFETEAGEILGPLMEQEGRLADGARRIALARAIRGGDVESIDGIASRIESRAEGASVRTLGWAHAARALTGAEEHQAVRSALEDQEDGRWWIQLCAAVRAATAGRNAEAVQILDDIDATGGSQELLYYARALQLAQSGDTLGAVQAFGKIAGDWRSLRGTIGRLLYDAGRYREVIRFLGDEGSQSELTLLEGRLLVSALLEIVQGPQEREEALRLAAAFDEDTDDPAVALLHARALLLFDDPDRTEEAARIVSQLLDEEVALDLTPLAPSFRGGHPELAARIDGTLDPLERRARAMVARQSGADSPAQLIAAFEERMNDVDPSSRRALEMRLIEALDAVGADQALPRLVALSDAHPDSARVQSFVLQRDATWKDQRLVSEAIGRLRRGSGDVSAPWRVFDGRRVLAFSPDDPAERSRVLRQLSEAKRYGHLSPAGSVVMAELLRLQGDEQAAVAELEHAYDSDPLNRVDLLPPLVQRLEEVGRQGEADRRRAELFGRNREFLPPEVLSRRAAMLFNRGELAAAEADYALLAGSGRAEAVIGLARVRLARGDLAGADQLMRSAAESSPTDEMLAVASEIAQEAGDAERARQYVDRISDDGARLHQTAVLAQRRGDNAATEEALRRAVEAGHAPARDALALQLFRTGRFGEIPAILTGSPDHRSFAELASLCRSATAKIQERMKNAVASVQEAEPALRFARALSGAEGAQLSDRLLPIVSAYPAYFPARHELALLRLGSGQPADIAAAIELLREGAQVSPGDVRPIAALAGTLLRQERWAEALDAARRWRAAPLEDTLAADLSIAIALAKLGRIEEALRGLEGQAERIATSLDIDPSYRTVLGGLYLQAGRIDDARTLLYESAQSGEAGARAFISALDAESVAPETARKWLTLAHELGGASPAFMADLASAWFRLASTTGDAEDFARAADGFAAVKSGDPGALAMYGLACEQAGRIDEAEAAYREAVNTDLVNKAPIFNNLAYLLVTKRDRPQDAIGFARSAVELSVTGDVSSRVSFLDTLGVAQLASGQASEAEATFREARRLLSTRQAGIEIGLCRALLDQGKKDDAQRIFNELSRTTDLQRVSGEYTRTMLAGIQEALQAG